VSFLYHTQYIPRYLYVDIQCIFYTLILTYLLRKLRQDSVLHHMTYSHSYGSTLVIFNDCCIHVLELPDDGPYVTDTCSIRKIHFCGVDGFG
jgi:hypothetical protein